MTDHRKIPVAFAAAFLSFSVSLTVSSASAQEAPFPLPVFDPNTPVVLDPLASHKAITGARPWRAPDYSEQSSALGWSASAFSVPAGMEKQVGFWKDIYTKYSTYQGVIHDAENIDLIYEVVDFSDVEKSGLPASARERLKKRMVEDAKKRAIETLAKAMEAKNPIDLKPSERRVWAYFEGRDAARQFREAMEPSRIRFQLGQKDRMEAAIFLSGRYMEEFEKIFREAGLPIELTRLVFVESSFNVLARSKVGASGLWQLMPGTVKPMRIVSPTVDGRNHPIVGTRAAAQILRDNYRRLESWPLALTGYNHGPAGVARLCAKHGTRDIAELVRQARSATFGFASRNFYASFLAAYEVEREASRHFPNIVWSKAFDAEELKLPQAIKYADLLNWFENDDRRLQLMNPHLTWRTREGHAIPAGTMVLIPSEKYSQALLSLGRRSRAVAATPVKTSGRAGDGRNPRVHRVNRGENLTLIAREYDVPLRELMQANNMDSGATILPGQRIRIPR